MALINFAQDAALLAPMADRVRPDDVSKGRAYNQTIGIVVGPDVKVRGTFSLSALAKSTIEDWSNDQASHF